MIAAAVTLISLWGHVSMGGSVARASSGLVDEAGSCNDVCCWMDDNDQAGDERRAGSP